MKAVLKQLVKPLLVSVASAFGPHARGGKPARLWVLMYHRILPVSDPRFQLEEPGMLVQPDTFDRHIQEMKRSFDLVSLSQWLDAHARGETLPERACAITFDDGWADNYQYAFPILKAHSAPATLFAVADKIGTDFQFWPNIVANLLLSDAANAMAQHPVLAAAVSGLQGKPSPDQISAVIHRLKQQRDGDIFNALADIEWQALCANPVQPALMSWDELREMKDSGLVDVGSHTCSHRRLTSALTDEELRYEIVRSQQLLQERLQAPIDLFCFPNGDYNESALALVQQHYRAAVTTQRGINRVAGLNLHELTRIGLHEEVSHSRRLLRARLSGWI